MKTVKRKTPELKVVVLTALDAMREEIEKIGCEAFIAKPFDMEELAATNLGEPRRDVWRDVAFNSSA